jgi:hypothetical protein
MANKKISHRQIIESRVPPEKQELHLWWDGKEPQHFSIYTNRDSMAVFFVEIAEQHGIAYQLSPFGLFLDLPVKLLPFNIPVRRPVCLTPEDRQRRRDWCRQIGLKNRKPRQEYLTQEDDPRMCKRLRVS